MVVVRNGACSRAPVTFSIRWSRLRRSAETLPWPGKNTRTISLSKGAGTKVGTCHLSTLSVIKRSFVRPPFANRSVDVLMKDTPDELR